MLLHPVCSRALAAQWCRGARSHGRKGVSIAPADMANQAAMSPGLMRGGLMWPYLPLAKAGLYFPEKHSDKLTGFAVLCTPG